MYSEGVPFSGSQYTRYQQPQMAEPQTRKNLMFEKLISSILFDIEKLSEFSGEIIFQIRP